MTAFSSSLMDRCRTVLTQCDKFESDRKLSTVFSYKELAPYRYHLPQAISIAERVENTLSFLQMNSTREKYPLLLIFLKALLLTYNNPEDGLHTDLSRLYHDAEDELLSPQPGGKQSRVSRLYHDSEDEAYGQLLSEKVSDATSAFAQSTLTLKLVERILAYPSFQKSDQIKRLLTQTFPALTSTASEDDTSPFTLLRQAIQPYMNQPWDLARLVYHLYLTVGDRSQWLELSNLFCVLYNTTISYPGLVELRFLLKDTSWSDAVLKQTHRQCIPDGWETPLFLDEAPDLFAALLEDLSMCSPQVEPFPLFLFLELLAFHLSGKNAPSIQHQIRKWISEQAQELNIAPQQIAKIQKLAQRKRHARHSHTSNSLPYLLLVLERAHDDLTCRIQAWLFDKHIYYPLTIEGHDIWDTSTRLADMPALLNALLGECSIFLGERLSHLVIECFLPQKWLNYPVEQWPVKAGRLDVALGIQYPLVVRSLDRARFITTQMLVWASWKQKWKHYRQHTADQHSFSGYQKIFQIWTNEKKRESPQNLYGYLHGAKTACLALTFEPSGEAIEAILSAGTPILFWPRKQMTLAEPLEDIFTFLFSQHHLAELPHVLWEKRKNMPGRHHYPYHLILLWDDPSRLPPIFTAPALIKPPESKGEAL